MRQTTLALNLIVVVFFVGFLGYTFFARQHLESKARAFVTEKTLGYSRPIVETADEALRMPLVTTVLSKEQAATIRGEIEKYRSNPQAYVADLTRQRLAAAVPANADPLLAKVASLKERIRDYYDGTLADLITDLRIFSISNLIAGLIALGLAYRSRSEIHQPIVWFSFLMFTAVLTCSYYYIDDLTFFRIFFRTHIGWTYPLGVCVMIVYLCLKYTHEAKSEATGEPKERTRNQ